MFYFKVEIVAYVGLFTEKV